MDFSTPTLQNSIQAKTICSKPSEVAPSSPPLEGSDDGESQPRDGTQAINELTTYVEREILKIPDHRPDLRWHWRKRLLTFEQVNYESSLHHPATSGSRIVDTTQQNDPKLWLDLLHFRERIDGLEGIAVIWNGFQKRNVRPTKSNDHWYFLWKNFLRVGYTKDRLLLEMCEFNHSTDRTRHTIFKEFYYQVMRHILQKRPSEAYDWHLRLKGLPLSYIERNKLFNLALSTPSVMKSWKRIHEDLPFYPAYSDIVPKLCAHELFSDAISWHQMLVNQGDWPSSTSIAKPLLDHLASSGKDELLTSITIGMIHAGVIFDTSYSATTENLALPVSRQAMNEVHSKFYSIQPKHISDEFCARLLATQLFSVKSIISGFHILGVDTIGPRALREMGLREIQGQTCHLLNMVEHMNHLQQVGISTGTSKFSRLVCKLVDEKNTQLLHDVITCDQDPNVFEDRLTQESLLASYHKMGDQRQIDRTMAILTLNEDSFSLPMIKLNILFRCSLSLDDLEGVSRIVETMRMRGLPLTDMSRRYMWQNLIDTRKSGRAVSTIRNVRATINIWQGALRAGTRIPLRDWTELLRRLGMSCHLVEYENLAVWLAKWYTDVKFRKSMEGLTRQSSGKNLPLQYTVLTSTTDPRHPLRVLFPPVMPRAVLAWGFQKPDTPYLVGRTQSERVGLLAQSSSLWGLRFIVTLRNLGAHFDRNLISKACMNRLVIKFGQDVSRRRRNRQAQQWQHGSWDEYALAMQRIWGPDLFMEQSTIGELSAQEISIQDQLQELRARLSSRIQLMATKARRHDLKTGSGSND
ncbi:hypothetical protein MMC19_004729 [Ptychographa xylographoides]|nr:hypothetical protein [Ptychographa xylographoides]